MAFYWFLSIWTLAAGEGCMKAQGMGIDVYVQEDVSSPLTFCDSQSTLSSAVALAQSFPISTIQATSQSLSLLLQNFHASTALSINCSGGTILLSGQTFVSLSTSLRLSNCTIESVESSGKVIVGGTFAIENCVVVGWESEFLQVEGGTISVERSAFEGNLAAISVILVWGSGFDIRNSLISNNAKEIVRCALGASGVPILTVANTSFSGNSVDRLVYIQHDEEVGKGKLSIEHCKFEGNSGLLFSIRTTGVDVDVLASTFINNTAGGFQLSVSHGNITVASSHWSNNLFPFLQIQHLSGTLLMTHCSFSAQKFSAPIQIVNTGDTSLCIAHIIYSYFHDYTFRPAFDTAGSIFAVYCSLFVSHTNMQSVVSLSPILTQAYGVIYVMMSYLELKDSIVEDSGGSGADVTFLLSSGLIQNVSFIDPVLGANGAVIIAGSTVTLTSLHFQGAQYSPLMVINTPNIFYIIAEMSTVSIYNLLIDGNSVAITSIVTSFYSKLRCENVHLRNIAGFTGFLRRESDLILENTGCHNCTFTYFSEAAGISFTNITNGVFDTSSFTNGLFVSGRGGDYHISSLSLLNVSGSYFLSSEITQFRLTEVAISGCRIDIFLRDLLRSNGTLQRVLYTGSSGGLVSASFSTVDIDDSDFASLHQPAAIINLRTSVLRISATVFGRLLGEVGSLATAGSVLTLEEVTVESAETGSRGVFVVGDSEVEVTLSSFRHFNSTLFACKESQVTVVDTRLEYGGFAVLTTTGPLHLFGGFLSCTDCASLTFLRVTALHLSADLGGFIYALSSDASNTVTIDTCEILFCTASSGGAVYLSGQSVTIANSHFSSCSANTAGGALTLVTPQSAFSTIEHTEFTENSAYEGGAVKWSQSQPAITDCAFRNNSAFYGPDIASYGVNLTTSLWNNNIPPGQPVTVEFNLVDHYLQKVVSANSQFLRLMSDSSLSFLGITEKVAVAGSFSFPLIEVWATPATNHSFTVEYRSKSLSAFLQFSVSLRACVPGELKSSNSCSPCAAGYYSFDVSDPQCTLCPAVAHCPGRNRIVPKPGAWSTATPSLPVLPCPIESLCLGGESNTCVSGVRGRFCSHCADQWFPLVPNMCWECTHPTVFVLEMALCGVGVSLFFYAVVRYSVTRPNASRVFIVKAIASHIQAMSQLAYIRMLHPPALQVFYRVLLDLSTVHTATFPFACFGLGFYYNVLAGAVLGLILVLLALCFTSIRHLKKPSAKVFPSEFPILLVSISWVLPVSMVLSTVPIFSCMEAEDAVSWLVLAPHEQCWERKHLQVAFYAATPALLLSTVVPTVLQVVYRNSKPVKVFAGEYKNYWLGLALKAGEVVGVCSTVLQLGYSKNSQVYSEMLLLYFIISLQSCLRLFKTDHDRSLQQLSNFTLLGSFTATLMYFEYQTFAGEVVLSGVIIVINVGFFAICGVKLARERRKSMYLVPREEKSCADQSELFVPNNSTVHLSAIGLQMLDFSTLGKTKSTDPMK